MITYQDIATQLRWMRENARDTAGQLVPLNRAELARRLGVTPASITQIERQSRRPDLERLQAWAAACGYSTAITFSPSGTSEEPRLRLQLSRLSADHHQLISLLIESCPDLHPILIEDLRARLDYWRVARSYRPSGQEE